jgi:hypothetical protein
MGSEVLARGDVFSHGILLLELFTGKRPSDDMFKEGLDLHKFANATLPEQVVDVVDPILLQEMKKIQRQEQTVATRFRGV